MLWLRNLFTRPNGWRYVRRAPTINEGFFTVLSFRYVLPEIERIIDHDPRFGKVFHVSLPMDDNCEIHLLSPSPPI